MEQSKLLAKSLATQCVEPAAYVRQAFVRILARPATADEVSHVPHIPRRSKNEAERARENLIVVCSITMIL